MPDNAFRNAAVRTGPWLLQCSGQHPTRHATPRRWRSVHFSGHARGAHNVRIGHTQSSHPGDHRHAVAYDMADPGADGCAGASTTAAVCSAQYWGRRFGGHCEPRSAGYLCAAAALRPDSYLRNCGRWYAAHCSCRYRGQYLTEYLHRYPVHNCAHRQAVCLGYGSGRSTDADTTPCWVGSIAAHPWPDLAPGNPMDYGHRRTNHVARHVVQRRAVRSGVNPAGHRATQGRPRCASSSCGYPLACTMAHMACKAGPYLQASKDPGIAGYCHDRA